MDVRRDADLRQIRKDVGARLDRFRSVTETSGMDSELRFRVSGEEGPRVV